MVKILIGRKYYVRHLNEKKFRNIFSGSSSTTNEPNFKIVCNCFHELLIFLRIQLNTYIPRDPQCVGQAWYILFLEGDHRIMNFYEQIYFFT